MDNEIKAATWIVFAIVGGLILAPTTGLAAARPCTEDIYVGTASCSHVSADGGCYFYLGGADGQCIAYG